MNSPVSKFAALAAMFLACDSPTLSSDRLPSKCGPNSTTTRSMSLAISFTQLVANAVYIRQKGLNRR
jgi:hypothetical protein